MPNISSSSQTPSPSIKGSTPVSEVLSRLYVRDPQHQPSGIYGRRATDFESRSPILHMAALLALATLIMGTLLWVSMRDVTQKPTAKPIGAATAGLPQVHSVQRAPVGGRSLRKPRPNLQATKQVAPSGPESLRARFMGPRMTELQWNWMGEGFLYQVYASASPTMRNAAPLSEAPIPATYMVWYPEDGVQNVWLAVKGIDRTGRETAYSSPLLLRLPI